MISWHIVGSVWIDMSACAICNEQDLNNRHVTRYADLFRVVSFEAWKDSGACNKTVEVYI